MRLGGGGVGRRVEALITVENYTDDRQMETEIHMGIHISYTKKIKVKKQNILIRKMKIERNRSLPRKRSWREPITGCSAVEDSLALLAERRVGPSSLQTPLAVSGKVEDRNACDSAFPHRGISEILTHE